MENQETALTTFSSNAKTFTTLKSQTIEDKKKLYNARKHCDVMLKDIKGQEIKVKDIFFTEYLKKDLDENGNPRVGHTTILFGEDGKTYVTASNYFFNSIAQILDILGGKIETPITIKVVGVQTKGQGEALSCEWL